MPVPPSDPAVELAPALLEQVLMRLGLAAPPRPDLVGLRAVYRAWSQRVPFDNVGKVIALRTAPSDEPLPGMRAEAFFRQWLEHGNSGTCWPSNNALFALLCALGFEARVVGGSMRDLGVVTHGSTVVRLEGSDWLVDSFLLAGEPLPLGSSAFVHPDPRFAIEVEPAGPLHLFWVLSPPNTAYMPCRLLIDPAEPASCRAAYESSRARSPFNQRLYVRAVRAEGILTLAGATRFFHTAQGTESRELAPDALKRVLCEEVGLSESLVAAWERCGGLAASYEPPSGPKPPPLTGLPPSLRR